MRSKHLIAASIMIPAMAGVAAAADLPVIKGSIVAPISEFSWTGPYVGGHLGYGWSNDVTKEYFTANRQFIGLQNYFKPRGFFGGVHAGYNWQFGSFVAGLETDAEITDIHGGFVDPPVAPFNPGGRVSSKMPFQGSLRARLGYAMGRTMVYMTGGVAMGQFEHVYTNWPGVSETFRKTIFGGTVGGGVEHAFTNFLTLRAEYRFTAYPDYWNHSFVAFPGASGTQHPRNHTLRLGASYKF